MNILSKLRLKKKLVKIRGENPFEEDSENMPSEENIDDEKKGDIIEMQYLYCWKCGKSIPVNSKFCLECGSDVKNPKVKDDDADKAPDKTIEIKSNNGNRKNIFIVVRGFSNFSYCWWCSGNK